MDHFSNWFECFWNGLNIFLQDFGFQVQRRSWIFVFIVSSWNLLIQNELIQRAFELIFFAPVKKNFMYKNSD